MNPESTVPDKDIRLEGASTAMQRKARFLFAISCISAFGFCAIYFLLLRNQTSIIYGNIEVDGTEREYRLVLRSEEAREEKAWKSRVEMRSLTRCTTDGNSARKPIVIALHGALDTTDQMAQYTKLDRLAEEQDIILVYLQGYLLNWMPFITDGNRDRIENDLRFFDLICDLIAEQYHGDLRRVYVVGVSQGGCMCNLLVAKRSERIAAAVSSCGWMPKPLDSEPLNTQHKTPILFLVGEKDRQVPPSTVRQAQEVFKNAMHPTRFRLIPDQGHGWPKNWQETENAWRFLAEHELPQDLAND